MKSATIELENPPPQVRLLLNPKRLRRVFYNLMHNATDAMPGGGKIVVRFITKENEVITEIEDSGPGIAPEIADRLFDAFATFGKAHGTGLWGLPSARKLSRTITGESPRATSRASWLLRHLFLCASTSSTSVTCRAEAGTFVHEPYSTSLPEQGCQSNRGGARSWNAPPAW